MTQQEHILNLLQQRGEQGAYVYEFMAPRPNGLGIAQYNARIFELRRKGFNIIDKEPGHFVLRSTPNNFSPAIQEIKDLLAQQKQKAEQMRLV